MSREKVERVLLSTVRLGFCALSVKVVPGRGAVLGTTAHTGSRG